MPADQQPTADPRVQTLRDVGAKLALTKSGHILAIDFRATSIPVADADVARLRGLPKLKELYLHGAQISDAAADDLITLSSLNTLGLQNTAFTDVGLAKLAGLKQLRLLLLNGTQVTREHVAGMRKRMLNTRIVFQ